MIDAERDADGRGDVPEHSARYIPPWKRVLLVVAVLAIAGGFVLGALGGGQSTSGGQSASDGTGTTSQGGTTTLSTSLLPQQSTQAGDAPQASEAESGSAAWSPFLVKGGFGFVVGFCIGYALRAFFKVSAIVMGVIFLALFGLQHFQVVTIDWSAFEKLYDDSVAHLSGQFESLQAALSGSVPSLALGGVGLFTGFKGRK